MPASNFRYSLPPFQKPTITSYTSQKTAYPATNALKDTAPRRPWKTTSTVQNDLILDFGSQKVIEAVLLAWVNYDSVLVAGSNDNSSYTNITPTDYATTGSGLLIPKDPDLLRRRLLVDLTGGLFNYRYLRIRIPGSLTTDDGAAYYSTGAITIGTSLVQMSNAWASPPNFTFPNPESVNEFPSGSKEYNVLGVPRVVMEFSSPYIHENAASHIRAIDQAYSSPMIIYPNFREGGTAGSSTPNPSQAYLMRRQGDAGRSYDQLPEIFNKSFVFEEVV